MTIDDIKKLKEREHKVELKEAQTQYNYKNGRRSLLGYITALANENGGKILFGVKENVSGLNEIVGSVAWKDAEGKLEGDIYRDKQIRVTTEVLHDDNKRVLVIHVPSRPVGKILKHDDVALMRVGEELLPMSDEQMLKILQEQEPDFSAKICEGLQIKDLDEGAMDQMKDKYAEKKNNSAFRAKENTQVLKDLGLMRDDALTYAALILLGKKKVVQQYLPQACVVWEFRPFEGQINHDRRENICLPLFLAIDHIWNLINSQNGKIPVRVGAYINDLRVFNEEVIREAILNAVTHRDYTVTSEVVIKQYPRKMIINNPGGFPKNVTIDNLLTINSTPRSRLMAEVLEKTGLVERSGQGVDKIYSFSLLEGKPEPSYKDTDLFQVSLNLNGQMDDKAFHVFMSEVVASRGQERMLSAEQIIVIHKVRSGQYAHVSTEMLGDLQREGLIVKVTGQSNRYVLPDKYHKLASKEQQIGKRYLTSELEQFLMALQGNILKIGDLSSSLIDSLTRNQVKYLVNKLFEDGIIEVEGKGKGTMYKMASNYNGVTGENLVNGVIADLRKLHASE